MTNRTDGGIFDDSNIWAETGDKTNPPFTETEGWDITYSQAGGNPVERTLLNRNFNKISAALYDVNRFGANLVWSNLVQYEIGATVIGSDNVKYTSKTVNTNIDPVSDSGTNWKKDIPVITGDESNINVITDARNKVSVSLTSNLSDKANKTLDNVTVGDFLGKFENSEHILWSSSGTKAKASFKELDTVNIIDTNYTFSSNDNGKIFYVQAITSDVALTIPPRSTVDNSWRVEIVFSALTRNVLFQVGDTANIISYQEVENNNPVTLKHQSRGRLLLHSISGSPTAYHLAGVVDHAPTYIDSATIPATSSISGNISLPVSALNVQKSGDATTDVSFIFTFPNLTNVVGTEYIAINITDFLQSATGDQFTGFYSGYIIPTGVAQPLSSGCSINLGNPNTLLYGQNTRTDQAVSAVVRLSLSLKNDRK